MCQPELTPAPNSKRISCGNVFGLPKGAPFLHLFRPGAWSGAISATGGDGLPPRIRKTVSNLSTVWRQFSRPAKGFGKPEDLTREITSAVPTRERRNRA